tara:strand:+ start:2720 stop:2977 length:258 start_codon:yes stop_codon:yes gene_type:complete
MARDYKKEYANYHSKPAQIKKRGMRNAANRMAKRLGLIKSGDGNDVHHRDGNPRNNKASNLKVKPASKNRSYARTKKAKKKNPKA